MLKFDPKQLITDIVKVGMMTVVKVVEVPVTICEESGLEGADSLKERIQILKKGIKQFPF